MSSTTTGSFPIVRGSGAIDFGLIFFSSSPLEGGGEASFTDEKYRLVIESTKFADRHGFSSVWIPERHFTKDGWLYPNPAVLQAALARETSQIHLRAGSVVMPLHHPIRVAEEWAMVDNLSNGRVGLSFASGWHPNDFVFFPEHYAKRTEEMYRGIEMVRKLWRGEAVQVQGGDGKLVEVRTYPTPVQRELPIWVTAAGNPKTFAGAGELGAHLLTHLYNQSIEELAEKIGIYREARAKHGFDPGEGKVSVMVHTYIGGDADTAYRQVEGPFCTYLRSASYLLNAIATSRGQKIDMSTLSEEDIEAYMRFVFERMVSTQRVLFGSPESCLPLVRQLYAAGVDEIACQMDFGVETELVLASMPHLNRLKELANEQADETNVGTEFILSEAVHAAVSLASSQMVAVQNAPGAPAETESMRSGPVGTEFILSAPPGPELIPGASVGTEFILSAARQRCREEVALPAFYGRLRELGIELGASFQSIEQLWRGEGEALGLVGLPDAFAEEASVYQVHPTLLDACLQVLIAALPSVLVEGEEALYLPTGLRSFRLYERPGKHVWSHATLTTDVRLGVIEGNVRMMSEDGCLLMEVMGLQLYRAGTATAPGVEQEEMSRQEQITRDWLYELRWERATLRPGRAGEAGRGRWLVFMDRVGVGEQLVELLAARGEASVRVYAGGGYEEMEVGERYQIDPARAEDVQRVLDAGSYRGVVYLWGLDGRPFEWVNAASLGEDELTSVGGAMHVVQGLAGLEWEVLPRAWLVTRGAQAIGKEGVEAVEQATLWGLGRTWAMEHAEVWGGLVDLDPRVLVSEQAGQLLEVLQAQGEDQVAFRDGQAYVARMVRVAEETLAHTLKRPVRQDATYMITGGLWGLGLEVAKWLVRRGARHLLLLGRTKLPIGTSSIVSEPRGRIAQQMGYLRVLEEMGAEVTYAAVDVADEQSVAAFLREYARQGKPAIKGVIHAASVWQDAQGQSLVRPLANTTMGALEAVMRPKVVGSWMLYRLLRGSELDFFVLFSSAASLFGSPGQGNYAAAGAFMDALAHRMRAEGTPALSVDWGAVSEIGFGATTEGQRVHAYWESRGIQRIGPEQMLATLALLMGQQRAQVGVIKLDWGLLSQYYPQFTAMPLVSHLQTTSKAAASALLVVHGGSDIVERVRIAGSRERRLRLLEEYSAREVASVLRVSEERLDREQPLTGLGLDSLMAIELKNRMERALRVRIPMVTFLQGPSIEQFAVQMLEMVQQVDTMKLTVPTNGASNGHTPELQTQDQENEQNNGMSSEEAEKLLTRLDDLSDAEVDALLSRMTLKEEENQ